MIFKNGFSKALLKFLILLKKILIGHILNDGHQRYTMINKILEGDSLNLFNKKDHAIFADMINQ